MELIALNNISILAMEEGGRSRMRDLQRLYYRGTSGLIFVVDSNDRERIDEARDKLHQMLNEEEFRNKPILIFANKQDLSDSMTSDELRDKLNLTKFNGNIKWHLQPACAIENEGLQEGFTWLTNAMVEKFDLMEPIIDTFNDTRTMKNNFISIFNVANLKAFLSKFV
jgi:signal recognition particle receptor subunit beta